MKGNKTLKITTHITYPAFALFALACFALSPRAQAVCQDGCLDNLNTALGVDALFNNTTGLDNTGIGWDALYSNTSGFQNTANGFDALESNTIGNQNTANGFEALKDNTTGSRNVAIGSSALF